MHLQAEQRQRRRTRYGLELTGASSPRTPVFQKHLSHDRRLPPSDFRSLQQLVEAGDPLQHHEHRR